MTDEQVKSPCISVCMLNNDDVCEGCYRTVKEITDWTELCNEQKQAVMVKVRERFKAMNELFLL